MSSRTVNFQQGERVIERIPLNLLITSHNPRRPMPLLQDFLSESEEFQAMTLLAVARQLVLGDEDHPADPNRWVKLVEKYDEPNSDDSLVSLAEGRRKCEIQPVLLRSFRSLDATVNADHKVYVQHYGVISGERRVLATFYLYAKYNTTRFKEPSGEPIGNECSVGAVVRKMTLDEAVDVAWAENLQRKDMEPLEQAEGFQFFLQRVNPLTDKKYTLKEVAQKLVGVSSKDYQFVRSRHALVFLTDSEKSRVRKGTLGLTKAAEIGLARKQKKSEPESVAKKEHRRKMITLKQCEALFDVAKRSETNYLRGLAVCMQITLEEALKESDARREAAEAAEVAEAQKVEDQKVEDQKVEDQKVEDQKVVEAAQVETEVQS